MVHSLETGVPRTKEANKKVRDAATHRIIDAAQVVFARKGSSATMADIASEAGVSQGLAYRYFPSKEAILTKLMQQSVDSDGGPGARVARIPGTPGERLRFLVSSLVRHRQERPEFYRFFYQVMRDEALAPDLRAAVQRGGRAMQQEIRKLIVEAQATGEVAKDDPDQLVAGLMALIDGMMSWTVLYDGPKSIRQLPTPEIVLRMLKPDSEARSS